MRELSPVKTSGVGGYYSDEDLVLQMMIYGDITPWRCARMMRIAEEEQAKGRMTLVLTEADAVNHLARLGFLVFRPATHGFNAEADIALIVSMLQAGRMIVINTNELGDEEKYHITRQLVAAFSVMDISKLSLIVESTEQFFARRWNFGKKAGMPTLNNLLKRAKTTGAHFAFASESPEEIAVEISRSCGTPAVGRISNHDRARSVGKSVDPRLFQHADEIYGIKAQNPNDFYLYNRTTAPRQDGAQGVLPIETQMTIQALTQTHTVPCWLTDRTLDCGFNPQSPTPGPDLEDDDQKDFREALETARDQAEAPAIAAKLETVIRRVAAPAGANDNAMRPRRRASKARKASNRLVGKTDAYTQLVAAGIGNGKKLMSYARTMLNARHGRLNVTLDGRTTARSVAQRVIDDKLLRDAINAGVAVAKRITDADHVVSGVAYATAYYQALKEDEDMARRFHVEMAVTGLRGGQRPARALDLEAGLRGMGTTTDASDRSESQYQFVRNAWKVHVTLNQRKPAMAA